MARDNETDQHARDQAVLDALGPDEELPAVIAINEAVGKLYGGEVAGSWVTAISWENGGPDPLDRVRCYRATDHWHYVGYGCSDLVAKSNPKSPLSGFGYELTFRLRDDAAEPPIWPVMLLQSLTRYTWDTRNVFRSGDWMPFGAGWQKSFYVPGVIFVEDPQVPAIDTVNGRVTFLQVVGVSQTAMDGIKADPQVAWDAEVDELRRSNPLLVTTI
jgi:suppressor of fused